MDAIGAGLVILDHHPTVLVSVRVVHQQDPRPVDDVGLGLGSVIWPCGILIHSALIEERNEVSVVINLISLQKYFGPEWI